MSSSPSWNSGVHSGPVCLGAHSLFLTAAGPERQVLNGCLQPVVIIEAGLGSSHVEWVTVARMIAERARVYSYDRAGYGLSQPSPTQEYTAQNRIQELSKLLEIAGIEPPYVLVGHSYGGVLVREFVRQHREQVAGMVIVDSPRSRTPLPYDWFTLVGNSTYHAIVGLDDNYAMSVEEYETIKRDEKRNLPTAKIEESYIARSEDEVNEALPEDCQALGDARLSVVFASESVDFTKVYNYGVEHGFGTEEARQRLAVWLKTMEQVEEPVQRANLGLSRHSRFVHAEGKARTHNLQYVAPELIRNEVFWVLGLNN